MAEVAGLVIGGIGLATLFDSAINSFHYIDSGKRYGREYQESVLKISILQLRLARWRNTVEITETIPGRAHLQLPVASEDETETVREILGSIQTRFKEAESYVKRSHKKREEAPEMAGGIESIDALTARIENLTLSRQKKASFVTKARWALHDQKKFRDLITSLSEFVDDLVTLFPSSGQQQVSLARSDAENLVLAITVEEPDDAPVALKEAVAEVDPTLQTALSQVAQTQGANAQYRNIFTTGDARVRAGDEIAEGYVGPLRNGPAHTYDGMYASGNARAVYGDRYGGKSVLDD